MVHWGTLSRQYGRENFIVNRGFLYEYENIGNLVRNVNSPSAQ
jgi:hypothetical protein